MVEILTRAMAVGDVKNAGRGLEGLKPVGRREGNQSGTEVADRGDVNGREEEEEKRF